MSSSGKPAWASEHGQDQFGRWAAFRCGSISHAMRWIRPGRFLMGSPDDEPERRGNETQHEVILSKGFWMAETACTQQLWAAVMGENPSHFKGERRPVENVSWHDVQEFLERLNVMEDVLDYVRRLSCPGQRFRLPTEAEWEYAARGGRRGRGFRYSGSDRLSQVGWFRSNSDMKTHEVGLLRANELRLHDMSGNVREWCSDWYSNGYYEECQQHGVVADPSGPIEGTDRIARGGSYFSKPMSCRSAYRGYFWPKFRSDLVGFRIVLGNRRKGISA